MNDQEHIEAINKIMMGVDKLIYDEPYNIAAPALTYLLKQLVAQISNIGAKVTKRIIQQ